MRIGPRVHRPDQADEFDADAAPLLLVLRILVLVEQRNAEAMRPFDQRHRHVEIGLFGPLRVELLDFIAIDEERDLDRLVAHLLGIKADDQLALAAIGQRERRMQRPLGVERPRLADRDNSRLQIFSLLIVNRRFRQLADEDRLLHDGFTRRQITFHVKRRNRQHVADVVEAEADIVRRQIVASREIDAHEIADRVVVFGPVEPPHGDAARIARGGAIEVLEDPLHRLGELFDLVRSRLRSSRGRHLAGVDLGQHAVPRLASLQHRRRIGENV